MSDQCLPQCLDDPLRMGLGARQGHRLIGGVPAQERHPGIRVLVAEPAHDRVDEGGGSTPAGVGGQVNGGADGGVLSHPHPHELVGPQTQDIEHGRIDLLQVPVSARGNHGVIASLKTQRPVGQSCGEAGITPIQLGGVQQLGQEEVGEGVVPAHAGEHLQRDPTSRVRATLRRT